MRSKDKIELMCVPPAMFGQVWKYAGHILLEGMAAAPDVPVLGSIDACRNGTMQLWLITRGGSELLGAFLTQIVDFADDGRWVSLFALAGDDMPAWVRPLGERMDEFARAEGARGFRFCGRKAWHRAMPRAVMTGKRAAGVFAYQRVA